MRIADSESHGLPVWPMRRVDSVNFKGLPISLKRVFSKKINRGVYCTVPQGFLQRLDKENYAYRRFGDTRTPCMTDAESRFNEFLKGSPFLYREYLAKNQPGVYCLFKGLKKGYLSNLGDYPHRRYSEESIFITNISANFKGFSSCERDLWQGDS